MYSTIICLYDDLKWHGIGVEVRRCQYNRFSINTIGWKADIDGWVKRIATYCDLCDINNNVFQGIAFLFTSITYFPIRYLYQASASQFSCSCS